MLASDRSLATPLIKFQAPDARLLCTAADGRQVLLLGVSGGGVASLMGLWHETLQLSEVSLTVCYLKHTPIAMGFHVHKSEFIWAEAINSYSIVVASQANRYTDCFGGLEC
jgi:hypothetical protein